MLIFVASIIVSVELIIVVVVLKSATGNFIDLSLIIAWNVCFCLNVLVFVYSSMMYDDPDIGFRQDALTVMLSP